MSKSEDYLDGLLNLAMGGTDSLSASGAVGTDTKDEGKDTESDMPKTENEFLEEFEKDLLGEGGDEEFLRQFEKEMDEGTETADIESIGKESLLDNLDGIVNSVKDEMEKGDAPEQTKEASPSGVADGMADALGDFTGMDLFADEPEEAQDTDKTKPLPATEEIGDNEIMDLLNADGGLFGTEEPTEKTAPESIAPKAEAAPESIASGAQMPTDGAAAANEEAGSTEEKAEEGEPEEASGKKRRRKKKEKKKKDEAAADDAKEGEPKESFLQRMSKLFFGEDEEEENENVKGAPEAATDGVQELTADNMDILAQLGGAGAASADAPAENPKDKKKKKEKKPKKEKPKKEKPKKEKKPKPKKEKKPKPPKEPDNTPPLPKKPVILIFVMAISFLVLVILGTDLFGYSYQISEAESAYQSGDYESAYQSIYGVEVKEADSALYEKTLLMANVSGEFSAYQTFLENQMYDMALDCLIRTIGRCEKYRSQAEEYGCLSELEQLEEDAKGALAAFGISADEACSVYEIAEDREEYSIRIYSILKDAGYEVAE
jgi:hypothetical protein